MAVFNQVLPGVYTEIVAGEREAMMGLKGVVTMPLELNWGAKLTVLNKGQDTLTAFGYDSTKVEMKLIREVMQNANRLILYRLNTGATAQGILTAGVTAKAKYSGTRGNDISVMVTPKDGLFVIKTFLDTREMDSQSVENLAGFKANDFITLEGTGTLEAKTLKLSGGTNAVAQDADYDAYCAELEKQEFNIIAYTGTSEVVKQKLAAFAEKLEDSGIFVQVVMNEAPLNDKKIINSTIGGRTNGYVLTPPEACATMAGIQAKCGIEHSATYFELPHWIDVEPRLTRWQQETRTLAGQILFVYKHNQIMVLYDINSLTSFGETNPEDFKKNLVIRTLNSIATDIQKLLDTKCIGKIRNSVKGRNQIKGMITDLVDREYLEKDYVEGFTADDVTIQVGLTRDSIETIVGVRVVDTVDKIYLKVVSL